MDAVALWYVAGLGMVVVVTISMVYLLNRRTPNEQAFVGSDLHEDWEKVMPKDHDNRGKPRSGSAKPPHRRIGVKKKRSTPNFARLSKRS